MPTNQNNGSHYQNHQRAAELHDLAAHAHRTAAEQHDKQDHLTGHERSRQALEHSAEAHAWTQHVHGEQVHGETAAMAYALWRERGSPEGTPEQDWLNAAKLRAAK